MDFVIFKNKHARYRKEDFGGLVLTNNFLYLLNESEYDLLDKINKKKYMKNSDLNKNELEIVKKFLYNQILFQLDFEKANKIINQKS